MVHLSIVTAEGYLLGDIRQENEEVALRLARQYAEHTDNAARIHRMPEGEILWTRKDT